jgi:hypothetical protein
VVTEIKRKIKIRIKTKNRRDEGDEARGIACGGVRA